jgi:hypothetical protein
MRRCILPGFVAQAQKYPDMPALGRLARQAPQHLKGAFEGRPLINNFT